MTTQEVLKLYADAKQIHATVGKTLDDLDSLGSVYGPGKLRKAAQNCTLLARTLHTLSGFEETPEDPT